MEIYNLVFRKFLVFGTAVPAIVDQGSLKLDFPVIFIPDNLAGRFNADMRKGS